MTYNFKDLMALGPEAIGNGAEYRDYTNINESDIPAELKGLAPDQPTAKLATWILEKGIGKDVRLALALAVQWMNVLASKANQVAEHTQTRQDNLEDQTARDVAQMEVDKDAVIANATVDSEVILARGGKATLGQRLDDTTAQLAHIEKVNDTGFYNINYPPIPMLAAKGDGTTDDTQAFQNAIDYCLENKLELQLLPLNYKLSDTLKIDTSKGHLHMKGVLGTGSTPHSYLDFMQMDGRDCIHAFTTGYANPVTISNIFVNGRADSARGIVHETVQIHLNNVRIRGTGDYCLYGDRSYGTTYERVYLYKTDGKTLFKLENSNLITANFMLVYGVADTQDPVAEFNNVHSFNGLGINLNGQKGLKMVGSDENLIAGYHEVGGTESRDIDLYSVYMDESSSNNTFKLQTTRPVKDFGYNNTYETTILTNTFEMLNPKKVLNNIHNPCFDTTNDVGGMWGGFQIVDEATEFSPKSLKATFTSDENVGLKVSLDSQQNGYEKVLVPDKEYIVQFSIKSNINVSKIYENREIQIHFYPYGTSQSVNIWNLPLTNEWKTYQFTFKYVGDSKLQSGLIFRVYNSTGEPFDLFIGDVVYAEYNELDFMPNYINEMPSTGKWIKGNYIPKSNTNGGFVIEESGMFKNLSPLTVSSSGRKVDIVSGDINQLEVGDIVHFTRINWSDHIRTIMDIDYDNNFIIVNQTVPQPTEYTTLEIKPPQITEV